MALLTKPTGHCKCNSKNVGLLSSCSLKSAPIQADVGVAMKPLQPGGDKWSETIRLKQWATDPDKRLTGWKLHRVPVKEVSFEIWRGAKVVNGVPPSRTPLIVQTLSVAAHLRLSSYGQAPSKSADIGECATNRLNWIHAHGDI